MKILNINTHDKKQLIKKVGYFLIMLKYIYLSPKAIILLEKHF